MKVDHIALGNTLYLLYYLQQHVAFLLIWRNSSANNYHEILILAKTTTVADTAFKRETNANELCKYIIVFFIFQN